MHSKTIDRVVLTCSFAIILLLYYNKISIDGLEKKSKMVCVALTGADGLFNLI